MSRQDDTEKNPDRKHLDGVRATTQGRQEPVRQTVAIVTGSSRGIGRELARQLAAAGHAVVLNGRDGSRLSAIERELSEQGYTVCAVAGDVTTAQGAQLLIDEARRRFGRIDVLFNNVGVSMRGPARELVPEVVNRLLRVNVTGAVLPSVVALPYLLESKGSIVFVSTVAAVHGFPNVSMYSAAKMALTGFAQSLYAEHATDGLHVATVYLGFTENDPDKTVVAPNGTEYRHTRRAHHTQQEAAATIVRAWKRRKRAIVAVRAGRFLRFLDGILPGLVDRVLSRSRGRIHQTERREEPED